MNNHFMPGDPVVFFFGLHRIGQGFQIVIGTSVLDLFMGSGPQWLCFWGVHWFSRTPFLSIWVWVKIGYTVYPKIRWFIAILVGGFNNIENII